MPSWDASLARAVNWLSDISILREWVEELRLWAEQGLLTIGTGIQAGCIVVALLLALALAKPARRAYPKIFDWLPDRRRDAVARQASELSLPILWLLFQLAALIVGETVGWPEKAC